MSKSRKNRPLSSKHFFNVLKIKDIIAPLEQFAPLSIQEEWDNSGLVVGCEDTAVRGALVCVDVTEAVMDEAEKLGANLVIAHHPIIFHPLKRLNCDGYVERIVERAIKRDIALYACHTNLDNAAEGMSHRLGELLGLKKMKALTPEGTGVVGELAHEQDALEFLGTVQHKIGAKILRHSEITPRAKIQKVAVCTGSGAKFMGDAKACGAQMYITADLKYNDFIDADGQIVVVDAGHFETEFCAIGLIHDVISKKFPNFAIRKSQSSINPVNYLA